MFPGRDRMETASSQVNLHYGLPSPPIFIDAGKFQTPLPIMTVLENLQPPT